MRNIYIGVMSGTSRDNLDGCLVEFSENFQVHETFTLPFSKTYKTSKDEEFISKEINQTTISLVKKIINASSIRKDAIQGIAFSGQTISHSNEFSLQAGDPQMISEKLSMQVISDFRNEDIRRGGIGAPLIPEFHNYIFGEAKKRKLILNIGGIANGTYLVDKNVKLASDLGPGNCLMDLFVIENNLGVYDFKGALASKGVLDKKLYKKLSKPLEKLTYPRADDIKIYTNILRDLDLLGITVEDTLRTLAELTVNQIIKFFELCDRPDEIFVHGGGAKNDFLMKLLGSKTNRHIQLTSKYVSIEYMEAAAFAYLAFCKKGVIFK